MAAIAVGCLLLGIVIGSRTQRGETPLPAPKFKRQKRNDLAPEEEMGWAMRDGREMHSRNEEEV
jgi:hypothetical protein